MNFTVLSLICALATIGMVNSINFNCKKVGKFNHPINCKYFIQCAKNRGGHLEAQEGLCPDGHHFSGTICVLGRCVDGIPEPKLDSRSHSNIKSLKVKSELFSATKKLADQLRTTESDKETESPVETTENEGVTTDNPETTMTTLDTTEGPPVTTIDPTETTENPESTTESSESQSTEDSTKETTESSHVTTDDPEVTSENPEKTTPNESTTESYEVTIETTTELIIETTESAFTTIDPESTPSSEDPQTTEQKSTNNPTETTEVPPETTEQETEEPEEPTTTSTTKPPFVCTSDGFFPDSTSCMKFRRCVRNPNYNTFIEYSFTCPLGTDMWCQPILTCSFAFQCPQKCQLAP